MNNRTILDDLSIVKISKEIGKKHFHYVVIKF